MKSFLVYFFLSMLTVILVQLKLLLVISWPWWVVLAPLWILPALGVVVVAIWALSVVIVFLMFLLWDLVNP